MPVGPLLPGRIPTRLLATQLQGSFHVNQSALAHLQQQASTGYSFFRISENPAAAARSIVLQRDLERNDQYLKNAQTNAGLLSATESSLGSIGDAIVSAQTLLQTGIGNAVTPDEKANLAQQVRALQQQVFREANATYNGRSLFGGTATNGKPFIQQALGKIVYQGDGAAIESNLDAAYQLANNVDGVTAFAPLTTVDSGDLEPALTLDTQLSQVRQGVGVAGGRIRLTFDDGSGSPQSAVVDLANASTLNDVKTRLEAAFAPATPIAVDINATQNGLTVSAAGGTIAIADETGSNFAADLGLTSGPAATIDSGDLNPAISGHTRLADLRGGAGVLLAGGLLLTVGSRSVPIDLSGAVTVEDALNTIERVAKNGGLQVSAKLNSTGDGFAISSRVNGENFSIAENGGTTATAFNLRTLTAGTPIAQLNGGTGFSTVGAPTLEITRRDGTTATIDLTGTITYGDVINRINAVDPGVLVASIKTVGNGIQLVDNQAATAASLAVGDSAAARSLGIAGTADAADPTTITGTDTNPQSSGGVFDLFDRLATALETGNDQELNRLEPLLKQEFARFTAVRGEVGARLQSIAKMTDRLEERDLSLKQSLSDVREVDLATVFTEIATRQASYEASLRIASQSLTTSLLNYL